MEQEDQLLDLLVDLTKWKNEYFFLSLLDFLCDKRLFSGNVKDAKVIQERYLSLLKSDGFDFGYDRWWIAPHPEQSKFGDDRYRNSSGENIR